MAAEKCCRCPDDVSDAETSPNIKSENFALDVPLGFCKWLREKNHYLYRTHKVALDPTPDEERLLTHTADYYHAAHNWGLRCYMDGKKAKQEPTKETLRRKWNAIKGSKYPWGKRMSQKVADYAFDALSHAIRAGKDPRLENTAPRFHSKTWHTTFRIGDRDDHVHCQGQYIELPRIGKIRMRHELRYKDGPIVKVTIKREAGRWYPEHGGELGR